MNFIDYVRVITKFLVSNGKCVSKIPKNQGQKPHNLFLKKFYLNPVISHDPDKMIYNFRGHALNTTEKSLLSRGFNFAIPPKYTNYVSDMLPFELFHRNVDSLKVSNLDTEFIESRLRDCAFPSYKSTGKNLEKNVPIVEFDALKILVNSKNIVAQKADKGNVTVILYRKDYVC